MEYLRQLCIHEQQGPTGFGPVADNLVDVLSLGEVGTEQQGLTQQHSDSPEYAQLTGANAEAAR